MRTFGIRTSGSEIELENTIKECLSKFPKMFTFYEMGTANGLTLRAVRDIIKESGHSNWFVIGTDLPDGYTFNKKELLENFNGKIPIIDVKNNPKRFHKNQAVLLVTDAREPIRCYNGKIQCVFIDACHAKMCVIEDFLTVERKIIKGGYIMFHDAGELERGTDYQEHCGQYINVRGALEDLGLLENKRPGWKLVREIKGDRAEGGWGNSCVVIEKT